MNREASQWQAGYAHRLTQRLIVLMATIMVLASLAVSWLTLNDFNRLLAPELSAKANLIGRIVVADFQRALGYAIPLESIPGADAYLDEMVSHHAELSYLAVLDSSGALRYQGGTLSELVIETLTAQSVRRETAVTTVGDVLNHPLALTAADNQHAMVHVGIDRRFVQRQLDDILFEIVVILAAAVLVTLEVMMALILVYGTGPLHRLSDLLDRQARGDFTHVLDLRSGNVLGRAARKLSAEAHKLHDTFRTMRARVSTVPEQIQAVGIRFGLNAESGPQPLRRAGPSDVRIPLFLFAFAEELQKSFLPLFVRDLYQPVSGLTESVVIGLPIAVYLTVLAITAPFAGGWTARYGSRRLFLTGVLPAMGGFLGCAVATSIGELVVWRGLTALGYAMITIACQDYVITTSRDALRGRSVIIVIGVIMSATMCGTAIGGILADRLGYQAVFLIAAGIALIAGILATYTLADEWSDTTADTTPFRLRGVVTVLGNLKFVIFLFCIAVPANVLVAAYLWYLVPLYLSDLAASTSEIARVVMLYYLLIVVAGPLASRLAERPQSLTWLVGVGSLLSSAGLILMRDWQNIWAVVVTVVVLGITHALAKGAQLPLALEISSREISMVGRNTVLGSLRFMERIGSMLGLLLAAVLVEHYGYATTFGVTGAMVTIGALLFLCVHAVSRRSREAST